MYADNSADTRAGLLGRFEPSDRQDGQRFAKEPDLRQGKAHTDAASRHVRRVPRKNMRVGSLKRTFCRPVIGGHFESCCRGQTQGCLPRHELAQTAIPDVTLQVLNLC